MLKPSSATNVKLPAPTKPAEGENSTERPSGLSCAMPLVAPRIRTNTASPSGSLTRGVSGAVTSRSTWVLAGAVLTMLGAWFGANPRSVKSNWVSAAVMRPSKSKSAPAR